ncbi:MULTISPECIES: hypothetical protein [unclassified Nocardiopsis]|uniref:hypothetical protein n=1 Tax=Nocardiopsis TaxID=2013 RepID=UPI00387B54EE
MTATVSVSTRARRIRAARVGGVPAIIGGLSGAAGTAAGAGVPLIAVPLTPAVLGPFAAARVAIGVRLPLFAALGAALLRRAREISGVAANGVSR